MADILIAHTQEDRRVARACGEHLAKQGYDVQWDAPTPKRRPGSAVRPEAAAAKAIVVIWSEASVRYRPLQREAEIAAATARLIAAHVKAAPPSGLASDMQRFVVGPANEPSHIVEALQASGVQTRRPNGRDPGTPTFALADATLAEGAWAFVDGRGDPGLVHHFMRRFPDEEWSARARARLAELAGADEPDSRFPRPLLFLVGAIGLTFVLTISFLLLAPQRSLVRIDVAANGADGAYRRMLDRYNTHLRTLGIELVPHEGSTSAFSNVQLLAEGKVMAAFIKGGFAGALRDPEYMNNDRVKARGKGWDHNWTDRLASFSSLGRVMLEPLWVFTFSGSETNRLKELDGEPISLGSMQSGSRNLAALLLERNGVRFKPGYWLEEVPPPPKAGVPRPLGEARALFLLQPPETPLVRGLLDNLAAEKEFDPDRIVRSAAFSPDGKRLAVALGDNTARIRDVADGRELAKLVGHEDEVNDVAISHDGKLAATASDDDTIRIWDAATGTQIRVLKGSGKDINSVAFSRDDRRILSASDADHATVRDVMTGKIVLLLEGHGDDVNTAAYSHDGRRIVTASRDGTAIIWDAQTGARLRVLAGHEKSVASASFSPDDKLVVTASWDTTARIWDAETGHTRIILSGHTDLLRAAEFSPDSSMVITASWDDTGRVWNAATGESIRTINGLRSNVNSAAFSPDGTLAMTASQDSHVRLWDTKTWRLVHDYTSGGPGDAAMHGPMRKLHLMNFAADANAYLSRFPFLTTAQLAKGSVKFEPHVPSENVTLLATSVAFVVDKNWAERNKSVVRAIVDAIIHKPLPGIDETTNKPRLLFQSGQFPTLNDPEYEVSTLAPPIYRSGDVPFLLGKLGRIAWLPFGYAAWLDEHAGTVVLSLIPLLGILVPLSRAVPALYTWTVRRRILYWYRRLQALERRLDFEDRIARPERSTPEIDRIDAAVSKIQVPLNYSDQYYDLRAHIELVRQRLAARIAPTASVKPVSLSH